MISCKTPEKIDQNRIRSQQWLYAFVGLLTTIPILLVTIVEIRKNDEQIVVSLVFFVQTMSVIGSILFTAFRCRTSDALLTILTILFLVAYVTIHFYIRFFFNHSRSNENFLHLTVSERPETIDRSIFYLCLTLLASCCFCSHFVHFVSSMDKHFNLHI